jgi:pimeloyl-ACP methyl ester carboxylesterase
LFAKVTALALATAVLLSACASTPVPKTVATSSPFTQGATTAELPFYSQVLEWTSCETGLQCSTAEAPLDWANPGGAKISLALIRHVAPANTRVGSIFVNPGGPGASGVNFVRDSLDYAVGKTVQASFDVIGFDPRGIGASTSVNCFDTAGMDEYLYGLPETKRGTEANLTERLQWATKFANACKDNTGDLLGHVDSISTARDLDMLRALVGDMKLNYVGYSYGTFIGAMYAQTFPTRVGHLVLDGAIDPTQGSSSSMVAQAVGFEMALSNYLTWCFDQSDCPFSSGVASAKETIAGLLAAVDATPIANSDGRELGADTLVTAIIAPLYSKNSWKYLNQLFTDVIDNDSAEVAFALADWYNDRDENGEYRTNQNEAYTAISCLDAPASTESAWKKEAAQLTKAAPLIGKYFTYSEVSCSVWPYKAIIKPAKLGPTGDSPILVIGTVGDPATPIAWADALTKQLTNGKLIRYNGQGHTGYNRGSTCVDAIVDNYLLDVAVPAKLSNC